MKEKILHASFNQDCSCLSIGTDSSFKIYSVDPFRKCFDHGMFLLFFIFHSSTAAAAAAVVVVVVLVIVSFCNVVLRDLTHCCIFIH